MCKLGIRRHWFSLTFRPLTWGFGATGTAVGGMKRQGGLPWQSNGLGLNTSTVGGVGLIPGQETKVPHASRRGKKKKRGDTIRLTLSTEPQKTTLAPPGRPRVGINVHIPGSDVSVDEKRFITHGEIFFQLGRKMSSESLSFRQPPGKNCPSLAISLSLIEAIWIQPKPHGCNIQCCGPQEKKETQVGRAGWEEVRHGNSPGCEPEQKRSLAPPRVSSWEV